MAINLKANTGCEKSVKVLKQLVPNKSIHGSPSSDSETWKCAFSPDDTCFAWSAGHRLVTILPCSDITAKPCRKSRLVPITIDCGDLVRSLKFCSIKQLDSTKNFWSRFAQFKDFFLITGHGTGRIRVWDLIAGKILLELVAHKDIVTDISLLPCSNQIMASTSNDGFLKIWNLTEEGNLIETLKIDGKPLTSCCWSPNGKFLAVTGASKLVHVYDTTEFKVVYVLAGHQHNVSSCDFSPDSSLLATGSWDARVIVWNVATGNKLKEFFHLQPPPRSIYAAGENGHFIRHLSFSPDGGHIASVADDGFFRIWDLDNIENPEAISPIDQALCCSYSPSGSLLAIG
ncbi:WD repeat and SOCS box-containing protein 1 isoform X2 [Tetranychus urticae]|nr:WD repeat and SOCS box-containing protein 1 isoform X2 [Tetranychus urticae]